MNRASTRCTCGRRAAAGEVTKIELKPGFYRSPRFSPDSKKIALVDSFQRLWYVDLETKKQVEVAQDYLSDAQRRYRGRLVAGQ